VINYFPVHLSRKKGVIAQWKSEDEVLLFDPLTEQKQVVNEAGLIIWYLCDGTVTREGVHTIICENYITDEELENAIDEFLNLMLEAGLIVTDTVYGFLPYEMPCDSTGTAHGPTHTPADLAALLHRWQQTNALDRASRSRLHLFRAPDGKRFLFEAESGLFFELSELGFALMRLRGLRFIESADTSANGTASVPYGSVEQTEEVISDIAEKFSASEVAECADESYEALTFLHQQTLPPPAKQRGAPSYTLSLHTSLKCNLACSYCFAASARECSDVSGQTMSRATAQRALDWFADFLSETGARGVIGFNLAAEPLMSWDLLMFVDDYRKHLECTRGLSLLLSMVTNGTLLTEAKTRCLQERGIRISTLSVDGPPDVHDALRCFPNGRGSYQAVARNLPHALQLFPRLKGAATLTALHPNPQPIAEHLLKLGFAEILIKPVRASHSAPFAITWENLESVKQGYQEYVRWLVERLESGDERILEACVSHHDFFWRFVMRLLTRSKTGYRCPAAYGILAVGPDGSIYPCDNFVGMEAFRVGDIWTGLNGKREAQFGEGLYVDDKESCRRCWARYLCGGGCYYCAQLVNDDIAQPDLVKCAVVRHLIELGIWFCATLAERCPEMFALLVERCRPAPTNCSVEASPSASR
jgi:radical SAM protein with 4Fe4S-binding SPASM domain